MYLISEALSFPKNRFQGVCSDTKMILLKYIAVQSVFFIYNKKPFERNEYKSGIFLIVASKGKLNNRS